MLDFLTTRADLIIALLALIVSFYALRSQRQHNRLTFKPLLYLLPVNYRSNVALKILNQGTGPLIIRSFTATKDGNSVANIISLMPSLPRGMKYTTYLTKIEGRAIVPGAELNIFEFRAHNDKRRSQVQMIRKALHEIDVTIVFENIYGEKETMTKRLRYFRHGQNKKR